MLPDEAKTKDQLINELKTLRQQLARLEALENKYQHTFDRLRESEVRYRSLFEESPVGVGISSLDGKVIHCNKAMETITGYSLEELRNINLAQTYVNPADRAPLLETLRQHGKALNYVVQLKRKDGTLYNALLNLTRVHLNGEDVVQAICVDITERKQAEKLYRTLFTSSPTSIFITQEGKIVFVNPQFCNLAGYSEHDLLGMDPLTIVHPEDWEQARQNAVAMLKGNRSSPYELRIITKRGETVWCVGTVGSIDYMGKQAVLGNFMDITERKQAEEREKQLQRELNLSSRLASVGELVAGVAHEINNPLTGIVGFSERLLRKITDEELHRQLRIIYDEALRAAKVVDNLRTFARRSESEKERSDINEILAKALELRAYQLKTNNIEVVTDLAPDLPRPMVNFQQVQQVFLNIILNAEEAMTEANNGGKLTVKTRQTKGYIRVSFADDGPGIPAEQLDRVFDPFFTTRGERGGTGLGLSLCHGIVAEHSGRLYVKSKPGKGATFFVELPLISEDQVALNEAGTGLNQM